MNEQADMTLFNYMRTLIRLNPPCEALPNFGKQAMP